MGFRGLGFKVLGFGVGGLGGVSGLRGSGFRVEELGFRVGGLGFGLTASKGFSGIGLQGLEFRGLGLRN